eukprot:CAMPEP_0178432920 /NCGR_PEP_ID=MMETSP0689_2-20121128/32639_1 /TAXON_ID=160604 /ORGANISM="Amphidinium massartii, Strain CS-259" /LENGTH=152 /DNA_ID=CAMNT_0020054933 /DNA_START=105 /DNA_END=559 /DNA_ORIENTATION=-
MAVALAGVGSMALASRCFTAPAAGTATQQSQGGAAVALRGAAAAGAGSSANLVGAGLTCSSILAIAAGAANAKASKRVVKVSANAVREAPAVLAGTGGPLPESFWDPAGLTKGKTDEELLQLRAAELKHGRVAMLAVFGWFTHASGYHYLGG